MLKSTVHRGVYSYINIWGTLHACTMSLWGRRECSRPQLSRVSEAGGLWGLVRSVKAKCWFSVRLRVKIKGSFPRGRGIFRMGHWDIAIKQTATCFPSSAYSLYAGTTHLPASCTERYGIGTWSRPPTIQTLSIGYLVEPLLRSWSFSHLPTGEIK